MNIERGNIYRVNFDPAIDSEQEGNVRPCAVFTLTGSHFLALSSSHLNRFKAW